ncbi:MAG TPA: LysE family translocator [Candidatus Krumholzibacteria bacterium]|nr:LysE family translocator [Candidatus Krumholzibacteria bacterium]
MSLPSAAAYLVFVAASLALLVVPGPAVMYIVARSIDQGRGSGIVSAMGLAVGSVVLILAAAFGVSALLATSTGAFNVVRYLGAAYLGSLGIRTFVHKPIPVLEMHAVPRPLLRIFVEGMVVNILNPKTALFFFAFLPQFVNPAGNVRLQIVGLGLTFTLLGVATDSVYAVAAGSVASRLRSSRRFPQIRRAIAGTTYIALSILALVVHPTKL